MGRPQRTHIPGIPIIIRQQGHNRMPCFLDGEDYLYFKELITADSSRFDGQLLGWAILPDAWWLVVMSGQKDISAWVQQFSQSYVRHNNRKYARCGTLWAGRYARALVQPVPERLSTCRHLIEQRIFQSLALEPALWPWVNTNLLPRLAATPDDIRYLDQCISSGLAYGDPGFHADITAKTGLSTTPARRGRPRKSKVQA